MQILCDNIGIIMSHTDKEKIVSNASGSKVSHREAHKIK